jgi:transposase
MATAPVRRPTRKGCPNRAVQFKRDLAAKACAPGTSVAKLALEHGVNTNLLFKWRRQYRAGDFGVPDPMHVATPDGGESSVVANPAEGAVTLLPVEVSPTLPSETTPVAAPPAIEVVFRQATVRIHGTPEPTVLRVVLDTLARRA